MLADFRKVQNFLMNRILPTIMSRRVFALKVFPFKYQRIVNFDRISAKPTTLSKPDPNGPLCGLEKGQPLSPIQVHLILDFLYPCFHPGNLIFEIPLVTFQHLFLFFRSEVVVSMRRTTPAERIEPH
jgi:hypothetical protein